MMTRHRTDARDARSQGGARPGRPTATMLQNKPSYRFGQGRLQLLLPLALAVLLCACLWAPGTAEQQLPDFNITLDKTTVAVGDSITASWQVPEGVDVLSLNAYWYIYDYSSNRTDKAVIAGNTATLSVRAGMEGYLELWVHTAQDTYTFYSDTFTITGTPNFPTCSVYLDKSSPAPGDTVTATWDIQGGLAPWAQGGQWKVTDTQGNAEYFVADISQGSASFTPTALGRLVFTLFVEDTGGYSFSFQSESVPVGSAVPLTCAVQLSAERINMGESITAALDIQGGNPPYTVTGTWYYVQQDDTSRQLFPAQVSGNATSFTPPDSGYVYLWVGVRDVTGTYEAFFSDTAWVLHVEPRTPQCVITLDKPTVASGQTITATWDITGLLRTPDVIGTWLITDTAGTTFKYHADITNNSASHAAVIGKRGVLELSLSYYSAGERHTVAFTSDPFAITGAPGPLACSKITLAPMEAKAGETITATWTIQGGVPPFKIECKWHTVDENDDLLTHPEDETGGTARFIPPSGGWAYFSISVEDSMGQTAYESSDFALIHAPPEKPVRYTRQMLNDKVEELAAACKAAVSGSYARAKWLNDWLVNNARYDYSFTYYGPEGVLLAGKGVCQSYAEAYQLLLNKVGITNRIITGEGLNSTGWGGHAWNLVQIGGNWYHVDTTWNNSGNYYFLKSDQSMSSDHRWRESRYPAASHDWGEDPESKGLPGDANGDQTVDIRDLVAIIDYIVSGTSCPSKKNADANGDTVVDIRDLVWIIEKIVGS